jgi:hypothetical protein
MDLTKKLGPLPVWAWGLILGIGGYVVYARTRSSTSTSSTGTLGVLDPNAVDPNTGLTYGQEEDAALNANASAAGGPLAGGGTTTDSGAQATVPTNEFSDFLTFLGELGQIQQALPGTGINVGTTASTATTTAAASTPVAAGNTPTVTATAHASPVQVAETNSNTAVLGQINSLLSQGFKKVAGTTQSGGLTQTGTYVYTPPKGASLKTGPTKYFVWGTSTTGLQIRAAT